MANAKVDLAQLFRYIQGLCLAPVGGFPDVEEELDFYKTVFSTFLESLTRDSSSNVIPIKFEICPIEKAKELALSIGLHILEGKEDTIWLCYTTELDD